MLLLCPLLWAIIWRQLAFYRDGLAPRLAALRFARLVCCILLAPGAAASVVKQAALPLLK